MYRKIIASLLLALILLTTTATPYVYAQETNPWYMPTFNQWYVKVYSTSISPPQEIFGERYTAAQVTWVLYSLISFIMNIDGDTARMSCIINGGDIGACLQQNPLFSYNTQPSSNENEKPLALIFSKNRDLSAVNYVRSKLTDLKVIPEAQAQGFGFEALNPVQQIWKAFRDVMYGFFVLIIIVYAFMIMFRTKISPQTVVTVQSALPKIIITLILVTFSYAIAGLLVDLMYVMIGLIALVFSNIGFFGGGNWSGLFKLLTTGPEGLPYGILGWFVSYILPFMAVLVGVCLSVNGIAGIGAAIGTGIIGAIIGFFILIGLIFWLFITVVKVFVILIKAYLSILISVIFAPLMIGFGAVTPTGGFGGWLKGLVSNLLVYPLTGVLLLLSFLFLASTFPNVAGEASRVLGNGVTITSPFDQQASYWYPPLTVGVQVGPYDPLPILWLFASLAILAMIPKVVDIIKGVMAGKGIEGGTSGIGAAFGAIGGYALGSTRFGARTGMSAYEYNQEKQLAGIERTREAAHIRGYKLTEEAKMKEAYAKKAQMDRFSRMKKGFGL
jgi:hypothetical protein